MNRSKRTLRRRVDGVLLLDKPQGMSSNAALQKLRGLFNAAKAGHTGTLDPMATGLLPICLGEATKFSSTLLDADKTYEATVKLGVVTNTCDAEGKVLEVRPVDVTEAQVRTVLAEFLGEIEQVPPMYSALKRNGIPLYELARKGVEVERAARCVTIHAIEMLAWRGDSFSLRASCSKGTYIRTLAADIGHALGCGAHLTALRRIRVGNLDIAQAVTIETIEATTELRERLLQPVDALLAELPAEHLDGADAAHLLQGQSLRRCGVPPGQRRLLTSQRFVGLGEVTMDGWLKPKRLIATA